MTKTFCCRYVSVVGGSARIYSHIYLFVGGLRAAARLLQAQRLPVLHDAVAVLCHRHQIRPHRRYVRGTYHVTAEPLAPVLVETPVYAWP